MQIQEFEDAKLVQKMFYAGQCFTHAKAAAEYVLKNNITEDDLVFYPLMTSLFVLYGKPFKNSRGIGSLGKEIIPVQHQELHRDLLKHRDQLYAHSDANAFEWGEVGRANQVRLVVRSPTDKSVFCSQLQGGLPLMPHVITLCLYLLKTVEFRKVKLCKQYESHMPTGVGEYVLNIDDPGGPLFKPVIAVIETG